MGIQYDAVLEFDGPKVKVRCDCVGPPLELTCRMNLAGCFVHLLAVCGFRYFYQMIKEECSHELFDVVFIKLDLADLLFFHGGEHLGDGTSLTIVEPTQTLKEKATEFGDEFMVEF